MEACLLNFISKAGQKSRSVLSEYGDLTQLNVLWAGTPDYDARIDQEAINSVPALVELQLTPTQLADVLYALEQIRTAVTNALPALTILAQV